MLSDQIISFYRSLTIQNKLPSGIQVMNPYTDAYTLGLCKKFYKKYYHDTNKRILLIGINPGRFGSGTTGISFTDPVRLESACDIPNTLKKSPELSSDFIYRMISAYGGPASFYERYFITSVSPLGFTKAGKNINYYDEKRLEEGVTAFAVESMNRQIKMGMDTDRCYCLGEGKNYKFLTSLNKEHRWFREVIPLPHPRYIMQYKRKQLSGYIEQYLNALRLTSH
ncbi:MAG: DUF4918 family protein [Cytophagales bacterium]|nr:DUF4918 family protein [Cytophagales bacterium]